MAQSFIGRVRGASSRLLSRSMVNSRKRFSHSSPLQHPELDAWVPAATSSRQSFLASLRDEHGVSRLADRQALCNALSKAVREGRVPGRAEEGYSR